MLKDLVEWIWRSRAYQNIAVIAVIALTVMLIWLALRREYWRNAWRQIRTNRLAMVCLLILSIYAILGLLDSVSWCDATRNEDGSYRRDSNGSIIYESRALSLLDRICAPLRQRVEKTYSAPLATRLFSKETISTSDGTVRRDYPRLLYGGSHLSDESRKGIDIAKRIIIGILIGLLIGFATAVTIFVIGRRRKSGETLSRSIFRGLIATLLASAVSVAVMLASEYHVLGTDKVGNDVLYRAVKGARTALIIGGFTTALAVPFAIFFGVLAGYFGGRIDDVVQYVYTTLASIPSILLIVAFMLLFGRGLFNLCLIMGITSWTGLCRLLRGETLKLRELEYVQSARAFGVSNARIIVQHIIPNLMHIVLISFLLRFSGLVLSEALLSYLQIGVEPTRASWGSMIDTARMELAREPVVWWNLSAAFVFMVLLVLSANLFGDAVRDALDPRLRTENEE